MDKKITGLPVDAISDATAARPARLHILENLGGDR